MISISVVPPSVPCVEGGHGSFHQGGGDIYQFVFWVRWEAEDQIEFQMCSVDCVDCVDMTPSPPSPPAACQQTMHWKAFSRLTSWEWYVGRVMLEYLILIFCLKIYIYFFILRRSNNKICQRPSDRLQKKKILCSTSYCFSEALLECDENELLCKSFYWKTINKNN